MTVSAPQQLEPLRLYTIKQLADLTGLSERTLYIGSRDETGNRMKTPTVTRLGTHIRFRGDHIRAWLDEAAGIEATEPVAIEPTKRGRGRPRKTARGAS
jgi:predicted DNA-binding transcriptional regulator AlpA